MNRYSKSNGDTATIRITLDENIKYPMYGDDYKKRPQYSADLIHQEALKWIDSQDGSRPFYGFLLIRFLMQNLFSLMILF